MELEPFISMFLKELRELQSSNERVASAFRNTTQGKELLLLRHSQRTIERRLDLLNAVVEMSPSSNSSFLSLPCGRPHEIAYSPSVLFDGLLGGPPQQQHSPPSGSSTFAASPAPGVPLPCQHSSLARTEILSNLPFLSYYNLRSPEVPFAVDHPRKPFFALQVMESMLREEFTPPIFVFASNAICALVRYPLHELLGCPLSKVSSGREGQAATALLDQQVWPQPPSGWFPGGPPLSYSQVIRLSPLYLPRNRKVTRLCTSVQFFYN